MIRPQATEPLATAARHGRLGQRIARLADPSTPLHFSWKGWTLAAALIAAILIPSLYLPLGADEAMFLISGQKILQGAIHYRDIIDIKPPLIYYLYAAGAFLFGSGDISLRIFDALLQAVTCWMMIGLVRRATGNDLIAATAPVLYLLLYIGQGYGAVGQAESYAGLLGIGMLRLLLFRRSRTAFIAIGALAGALALFKFTLGIMLAAALLAEFTVATGSLRERTRNCMWMLAGFGVMAVLFALYLTTTGALANFILVNRFLRGYAKLEFVSAAMWLRNLMHGIAAHFSDNYSIALFIATCAGIGLSLLRPEPREGDGAATASDERRLLRMATLAFLMLLLSVIVEAKYYHYHFSRIYPFGAMLAAIALVRGTGWIASRGAGRDAGRGYGAMIWSALLTFLLIFGPLPHYAWQCVPMFTRLRGGDAAFDALYDRIGSYYPRSELRQIGAYIASRRQPDDRVFAASSIAALVYHFSNYIPDFGIYHSGFYLAKFTLPEFKDATRHYLLDRHPRFVITQINDTTVDISGVRDATSATALMALPGIDSLLRTDYAVTMRTKFFEIREREEGGK